MLVSPEFQEIINRLSQGKDSSTSSQVYLQCAHCHDPEGIAAAGDEGVILTTPQSGQSQAARGIGCESCHGGAKEWLSQHYQRGISKSSLVAAGMLDTENLLARGRLCASCHVGDGVRDMNHDMIAAGHPPLRFELAAYHRKLTHHDPATARQSHWDDARPRIATSDFETRLWAAGQITSAQSALALLESRARRAASSAEESPASAPWPELSEYDCFACHQRLRPTAGGGKLLGLGLPTWGKWNFALLLDQDPLFLGDLRREMHKAFAAEPDSAERAVKPARAAMMNAYAEDISAHSVLRQLSKTIGDKPSWETLCHRYLGLLAVEKAIGDEFQKLELAGSVSPHQRIGFNRRRKEIDQALRAVGDSLSFADDKSEWPRALNTADGLTRANAALDAAAERLEVLQTYAERGQ